MLASRSLAASLRRTAVLVGALSTAIAMMAAVGILVGSFRESVVLWMSNQLPADLYLRPRFARRGPSSYDFARPGGEHCKNSWCRRGRAYSAPTKSVIRDAGHTRFRGP